MGRKEVTSRAEVSRVDTSKADTALLFTALATVFCSSAAIMVLQLVAGRLVAAYLGQSLYTWTSAIGVTLAGIALGNALGGRLADRSSGTRTLALQMLASAGCVLLVLVLNPIAGALPPLIALPWSLRIFLHITLVFFLPFTALGTISPVISKLALSAGGPAGRRIGSVFAWSIGGSLLGVFLTGYFLLAWAGNRSILVCSAGILAVLGAALFLRPAALAPSTDTPAKKAHRVDVKWLLIAALAGAFIMMLELSSARMLSRVYGSSLFTWTTAIGVILAAMSLGGRFGGRWADRFGADKTIAGALIAASAVTAAVPLLHNILFRFPIIWDLSWPFQILAHTFLVFFLPCFLLGAVVPAIVKQVLAGEDDAGRVVGLIYAWNSLGSIAGALLTGFVLIAALGTVQVICLTFLAAAAAALYATPMAFGARIWAGVAVLLGLAAFAPIGALEVAGLNLGLRSYQAPGTVFERESQYSYIAVNEFDPDQPGLRTLALDKLVHNKTDLAHPLDLKYPYMMFYAAAIDALYPAGTPLNTLSIGGGGYNFITYLETTRPGGKTVAVEIDPAVTEAAHAAFGFPNDTKALVRHMDARNYVAQAVGNPQEAGAYDVVFGDCFSDYSVPFPLTTIEYTEQVGRLMKDNGVYLLNVIDLYEVGNFLGAVIGTCNKVFPNIAVFSPTGRLDQRETFVLVASKQPLALDAAVAAVNAKSHEQGRFLTPEELNSLRDRAPVKVLTDDFAPVENLLAPVVLKTEESVLFRRLTRADGFMLRGQPDKAAREAEIIVAKSKNFPEAFELLANAYGELGEDEKAVEVLRTVAKDHPTNGVYQDKLAIHLFRSGKPQEAIAAWQQALTLGTDPGRAHLNMGAALVQMKRYGEAETQFRAAAGVMPGEVSPYVSLAAMEDMRGNAPGAVKVLQDAAAKFPKAPELQQQLAIAAFKAKDYDTAWAAVHAADALGAAVPPDLLRDLRSASGRAQ